MIATPAEQARLLDLADLDTQLDQLDHRRRTLPEHDEIAELMAARQSVTEALVAVNTALSDAEVAQERADDDLRPVKERLARNQQRTEDGSVTDPKALRGLLDEIDHLKVRISKLEDSQLEIMQVVEDAAAQQRQAQSNRDAVDVRLREVVAARDRQVGHVDDEIASRRADRRGIVDELPADLVALYEKIRARSGLAAARLVEGRCTGCRLQLTSADLHRYAAARPDEVLRCVECDRILVRDEG